MALLKEGMKQDESKTQLPSMAFWELAKLVVMEDMSEEYKTYFLDPAVQDCAERVFQKTAAILPDNVFYQNALKYQEIKYCIASLQYDKAAALLRSLPMNAKEVDQFLGNRGIGGEIMPVGIPSDACLPEILYAMTSSVGADILTIEKDYLAGAATRNQTRTRLLKLANSDMVKQDAKLRNDLLFLCCRWTFDKPHSFFNLSIFLREDPETWKCIAAQRDPDLMSFLVENQFDPGVYRDFFFRMDQYPVKRRGSKSSVDQYLAKEKELKTRFGYGQSTSSAKVGVNLEVTSDPERHKIYVEKSKKPGNRSVIVIECMIDGMDWFRFNGRELRLEHFLYDPIESVVVNGQEWEDLSKPFLLPFSPDYSSMSVDVQGRDLPNADDSLALHQDTAVVGIYDKAMSKAPYSIAIEFGGMGK